MLRRARRIPRPLYPSSWVKQAPPTNIFPSGLKVIAVNDWPVRLSSQRSHPMNTTLGRNLGIAADPFFVPALQSSPPARQSRPLLAGRFPARTQSSMYSSQISWFLYTRGPGLLARALWCGALEDRLSYFFLPWSWGTVTSTLSMLLLPESSVTM